ncbi:MAG: hypothetical protein L0Z62_09495 [Gemmataceae bacterium]|nr:hypothetical protein [Gemmataceae bacterium]
MIKWAMLLGLFSVACTVNAQEPDKNRERAERIRALQRQIMELETIGRIKVLQDRGIKPARRPAVKTDHNVEQFAPVTARFVRFTVLATVNGAEACLDALEIYGPDSPANLTAAEGVRLTASSVSVGQLGDFKGGKYVKGWCWVARDRGPGWVQVELPALSRVSRVVWSRDAQNRYHDRFATAYRVEVAKDGRAWRAVATGEDRVATGQDLSVSRSALIKALDPSQRKERQGLMEELRKLGAPIPNEVRSGPQVGEGINGAFAALGLNGPLAGKRFCPV